MSKLARNLCLLGLIAAVSMLAGCGQKAPAAAGKGAAGSADYSKITLTYALQSAWKTLVPFDFSGSSGYYGQLVWDKIYDKLVYAKDDGSYAPRAAKSWEVSKDKKTFTFHLDEKARWQDGEKVTAEDWVWTARLMSNPDFNAPDCPALCVLLEGTDKAGKESSANSIGVSAPDDYTLVMKFKKPMSVDSFFVTYMHYYSVLPKHILGKLAAKDVMADAYWKKPIGSGPCRFESEIAGSEIDLSSFADYHLGAPKFGKLVMKVLSSSNFASSFMTGEIDYAYPPMGTEEALALKEQKKLSVVKANYATNFWFIAINNKTIPDLRIRRAMNLAVDKDLIAKQLFLGEAESVESVEIPKSKLYNASLKGGRDVEGAKALLKEAKWDSSTVLTLATPTGVREKIANILQQNFAEIGLKIDVETLDIGAMFGGLNKGTYPMGLVGGNASFDPMYINSNLDYRKKTFFNVTDTKYVELADAIVTAPDETAKSKLVMEYQAYMAEKCPLVPMVTQYAYGVKALRLKNMNPFDSAHSNDEVWNWVVE